LPAGSISEWWSDVAPGTGGRRINVLVPDRPPVLAAPFFIYGAFRTHAPWGLLDFAAPPAKARTPRGTEG